MAAPATLRFEPVSCVLTLVEGDVGEPAILDISNGRAERITPLGEEHFADLHGAVLYLGPATASRSGIPAAGILDLPTGRERLSGEARFLRRGEQLELFMKAVDSLGVPVIIRAVCRDVDTDSVLTQHAGPQRG